MSRLMLTGGFVGFLVVFIIGIADGRNIFIVLRDSMIACLVMALLLRMFYNRIESLMVSVLEKERRAMDEATKAESGQEEDEAAPVSGPKRKEAQK